MKSLLQLLFAFVIIACVVAVVFGLATNGEHFSQLYTNASLAGKAFFLTVLGLAIFGVVYLIIDASGLKLQPWE
ncbi:hypothetical protein BH11CYA1_BH11CYA1_33120 [soil metagenome]